MRFNGVLEKVAQLCGARGGCIRCGHRGAVPLPYCEECGCVVDGFDVMTLPDWGRIHEEPAAAPPAPRAEEALSGLHELARRALHACSAAWAAMLRAVRKLRFRQAALWKHNG